MTKKYQRLGVLTLSAFLAMCTTTAVNVMASEEQMQKQIDIQAAEIRDLKKQVQMLLEMSGKNKETLAEKVDKTELEELKVDKIVSSKNKKAKVTLYGQVNRAGLFADNGDSSEFYFVDNDNSSTRMGIAADAKLKSGQAIGAKIEYELESNSSSSVSNLEKDTSADIKIRHTDLWFKGSFGKLSIGRGSTASDGTAESDLSGTTVVTYNAIGDMAGGQIWYSDTAPASEEEDFLVIGDVYDNMDGLSRRDRFRYDSPDFSGFSISGSAVEDDAFDLAARYSRKYDAAGIKVATSVGWADGGDLKSYEDQLSGSLSILHDTGLNLTFAAGQQNYDDREDPFFWYSKLGYQSKLMSIGKSSVSIDYGQYDDVDSDGDEAEAFSIAFVQKVDDWSSEIYIAWRQHMLDTAGTDYDDISAIMMGARVKF